MDLTEEQTKMLIDMAEETLVALKVELDRIDGYFEQAKKDVATWGGQRTRLERKRYELSRSLKVLKGLQADA